MARDSVHALIIQLRAVKLAYVSIEPKRRCDVRKGSVARKVVTDVDLTQLDTTVPLIKRFGLRGKNPRRAES